MSVNVVIEKLENSDKFNYSITTSYEGNNLISWVDLSGMIHTDLEYLILDTEAYLLGAHFLAVSTITETIDKGYNIFGYFGYDSDVLDGLLDVRYIVKGFPNET